MMLQPPFTLSQQLPGPPQRGQIQQQIPSLRDGEKRLVEPLLTPASPACSTSSSGSQSAPCSSPCNTPRQPQPQQQQDDQQRQHAPDCGCSCCSQQAECPPITFIPMIGSLAEVLSHRRQQQKLLQQQQDALCAGFQQQLRIAAAANSSNMDLLQHQHQQQQHSLQLAWEQSSSDWHPQPLDTLVAVVGAPPGWMTMPAAAGADSSAWATTLRSLPEPAEEGQQQQQPTHTPKVCMTVSTVSSQLDSLAILPLNDRVAGEQQPAQSPTALSNSLHLGEF